MTQTHIRAEPIDDSAPSEEPLDRATPVGGTIDDRTTENAEQQLSELRDVILEPDALAEPIREGLIVAINVNKDAVAEAVSPIIVPAVRRAVAQALSKFIEETNKLLDNSLSPRNLGYRIQAARTGRSLAEVILEDTLLFQVEQVFLIHRNSGLLAGHVATEQSVGQLPEVVSQMLTAIQDFVQDSFGEEDRRMGRMQVGGRTVVIEDMGPARLAVVVDGTAPQSLSFKLQETLETIVTNHQSRLAEFDGDPESLADLEPVLRTCLVSERRAPEPQRPWAAYIALSLVLFMAIFLGVRHMQWRARAADAVATIDAEPGYRVLQHRIGWWQLQMTGLRDPLARDPVDITEGVLQADDFDARWGPTQDPRLALVRVGQILSPPPSVTLDVSPEGTLVATGTASAEWRRGLPWLARTVAGIQRVDLSGLANADAVALRQAAAGVERLQVTFEPNEATPADPSEVQALEAAVKALDKAALDGDARVQLLIEGSADASGREALNRALSEDRAQAVANAVAGWSLWRVRCSARSVWLKRDEATPSTPDDRSVRFRVQLTTAP